MGGRRWRYSNSTRGSSGGYTEAIVTLVKDSNYTLSVGHGGEGGGLALKLIEDGLMEDLL